MREDGIQHTRRAIFLVEGRCDVSGVPPRDNTSSVRRHVGHPARVHRIHQDVPLKKRARRGVRKHVERRLAH
eukprot:1643227-Prymnesium_polylepis.1